MGDPEEEAPPAPGKHGRRRSVAPVPVVGARPERGSFLSGLGMDLRVAWRLVVRNPGFTAVVVLTLALGVGLNSSIFSLVNYLLLRPLPVESPEELVQVYSREPGGFIPEEPMSYPDYRDVREKVRSLQDALAWAGTILAIEGDVEPQIVIGGLVSGQLLRDPRRRAFPRAAARRERRPARLRRARDCPEPQHLANAVRGLGRGHRQRAAGQRSRADSDRSGASRISRERGP